MRRVRCNYRNNDNINIFESLVCTRRNSTCCARNMGQNVLFRERGLNATGTIKSGSSTNKDGWFANTNASSIRAGLKGNFYVSPNGTVYIGYYDSRVPNSSYSDAKGSNIKTSRARLYCRGNLIVGKSGDTNTATLTVYGDIRYTGTCKPL